MPQPNPLGRYLRVQTDNVKPARTYDPYRKPTPLEWFLGIVVIMVAAGLIPEFFVIGEAIKRAMGW